MQKIKQGGSHHLHQISTGLCSTLHPPGTKTWNWPALESWWSHLPRDKHLKIQALAPWWIYRALAQDFSLLLWGGKAMKESEANNSIGWWYLMIDTWSCLTPCVFFIGLLIIFAVFFSFGSDVLDFFELFGSVGLFGITLKFSDAFGVIFCRLFSNRFDLLRFVVKSIWTLWNVWEAEKMCRRVASTPILKLSWTWTSV